jgi:hypothetical protein
MARRKRVSTLRLAFMSAMLNGTFKQRSPPA